MISSQNYFFRPTVAKSCSRNYIYHRTFLVISHDKYLRFRSKDISI